MYLRRCDICKSKIYEDTSTCSRCHNCCCTCGRCACDDEDEALAKGDVMVGGIVVQVKDLTEDEQWILCHDSTYRDTCSVVVKYPTSVLSTERRIRPGDKLWWQSGTAYWTPATYGQLGSDVKLEKMGGSGVSLETAREVRGLPHPNPKPEPEENTNV